MDELHLEFPRPHGLPRLNGDELSTNVERPGYTMSEKAVGATFKRQFTGCDKRIIVTTFASNVHRIQQVLDAAAA